MHRARSSSLRPGSFAHRGASRIGAAAVALGCVAVQAGPPLTEWNFQVFLDGKPIGAHRYTLTGAADGRASLRSEARFDVSLLGVPLYRYRHRSDEQWVNGCLASIEASTDDNGRHTELRGQARDDRFDLGLGPAGRGAPPSQLRTACLLSFAYWNPDLARQEWLLDPGSGRVERVAMAAAPGAVPADLRQRAQGPVRGLRIGGLAQPIDVWYEGERWIGLDTVLGGNRRLSYRLS